MSELTREQDDVCAVCTAKRPYLCDKHYQEECERFVKSVEQAIADPRTAGGVKSTYHELLTMNAALRQRVDELEKNCNYKVFELECEEKRKALDQVDALAAKLAACEQEQQYNWNCFNKLAAHFELLGEKSDVLIDHVIDHLAALQQQLQAREEELALAREELALTQHSENALQVQLHARKETIIELKELNAKHVLNRIDIEGQFLDLRATITRLDGALNGAILRLVELNPKNYNDDDVCETNNSVISAVAYIREALKAQQALAPGNDE